MPTAEREQLPREVARSLHRVQDGVDVRVGFLGKLLAKELGIAADDGQDVVEVVSDPAGEASDRLHLLGLAHLLLELLPAGDVLDHRDRQAGRSGVAEVDVGVDDLSVASDETPLENGVS